MRQIAAELLRAYPKQAPALRACLGLISREGIFQPMCSGSDHEMNVVLEAAKGKMPPIAPKSVECQSSAQS
ncbi:hypothetical protein [Devosia sp. Root635]|uniref:hypothetical protein n=1 Tax=Devosia sp. Root635 TaxID=1736575 RepID=UPI0006F5F327|nr:hypothetical protein [Devosia sp. Root635]KRA55968.1 hypothetical protein ASD80_01435 [Devosia sp. Root635]